MIDRYAASDKYTYPDSQVLRNKAGLRDAEVLDRFERTRVAIRALEPGPPRTFDYKHFRAIHRHLFQDVYDWAGEERTVDISKGRTRFAGSRFIRQNAEGLFAELHRERLLVGNSREGFAKRAAYYLNELNILHPFREGNGRVAREFLRLLSENAGYDLDPSHLTKEAWLGVCVDGVLQGEEPMAALIFRALQPL